MVVVVIKKEAKGVAKAAGREAVEKAAAAEQKIKKGVVEKADAEQKIKKGAPVEKAAAEQKIKQVEAVEKVADKDAAVEPEDALPSKAERAAPLSKSAEAQAGR